MSIKRIHLNAEESNSSPRSQRETTIGVPDSLSAASGKQIRESLDRDKITAIAQTLIISGLVVASVINLSLETGNSERWASLLSLSLGILCPTPKLGRRRQE